MPSVKRKQNAVGFRLIDITTEQFASLENNYDHQGDDIEIGFETSFKLDKTNHVIGSYCRFNFYQNDNYILIAEVACHFKIMEQTWDSSFVPERMEITFPKSFLTHLLVLTVGTARGVIQAKKPKSYVGLILPTFDVTKVVVEDMTFDLNAEEEE